MTEYKFNDFLTDDERKIRTEVFIKEQGFKIEFDEIDENSVHLVVYNNKKPVGCARLIISGSVATFGRIAVLKEERKNHFGSKILRELENKCKELGIKKAELSAQYDKMDFYNKFGFVPTGKTYYDEHCKHIKMTKNI